jgi:hypothetical protein
MKLFITFLGTFALLAFAGITPLRATVVDFEAQTINRGGNLIGTPDSPLTIGVATFTGGELLHGEIGLNADTTGAYASEGLFGSGEINPIDITFTVPVQNFSVLVLNGDDTRSYTVTDNLGDSFTNSLASAGGLGAAMFSLPATGLTTVTITSANEDAWDFAIDNVTFTPSAATSAPEPESILLLGAGLLLLIAGPFRKGAKAWLDR